MSTQRASRSADLGTESATRTEQSIRGPPTDVSRTGFSGPVRLPGNRHSSGIVRQRPTDAPTGVDVQTSIQSKPLKVAVVGRRWQKMSERWDLKRKARIGAVPGR